MLTMVKDVQVFAPESLGKKDILIAGSKIIAVKDPGKLSVQGIEIRVVPASDKSVFPGLIDPHVHILGGGGEGGPATRTPEIRLEDIVASGVTTVIGCMGTDGTTRHMESLLAKARGLESEGITTFVFAGSYELPVKTITGSVRSDLVLIEKVIGAGEIALSDHRSSQPTFDQITQLAAECRVGGMLGGKAGILHVHMGVGGRRLEMLFKILQETEIPSSQIIATHVNRNSALMQEAVEYVLQGGYVDLTAGNDPTPQDPDSVNVETAVKMLLEKGAPLSHVTVSSDSNGSLPVFDKKGKFLGLEVASQKDLLIKFRSLLIEKILKPEDAIKLFSTNAAAFYKLKQKGKIDEGMDADLIFFDKNYNLTDSITMGQVTMQGGKITVRGTFS